jgi:hypothetical protein
VKVEYKAPSVLTDEQREVLALVNSLKPGFKTAIHGALQEYVAALPAIDRYPQRQCAYDLLQALMSER